MIRKLVIKKLSGMVFIALTSISPVKAQNLSETYELALQNDPVLKQAQANQLATGESQTTKYCTTPAKYCRKWSRKPGLVK